MAYQRAIHPPSSPLAKALGPALQNWSTKNISRFPFWDFIKGNSIWVQYHSTSMSTLKHCLQVLICCNSKWLPVPSRQQHKRVASLSFPSLLLTVNFRLCKNEGLWKNLLKLYHDWKDRFPSQFFHVQSEESRGPGCSKADGGIQVAVGTVERYLTWTSQSLPQLLVAELELITLSSLY